MITSELKGFQGRPPSDELFFPKCHKASNNVVFGMPELRSGTVGRLAVICICLKVSLGRAKRKLFSSLFRYAWKLSSPGKLAWPSQMV